MIQLSLKNKTEFINNFLAPIGKLAENTVLKVSGEKITAVCASNDGTLIVNCTYTQSNNVDEPICLNIPDINKLIKILSCIPEEDTQLQFNNNNIEYQSNAVGFKYHLLEDGIIDAPSVDINKIKQIDFNFKFCAQYDGINRLIKGSTFTTDTDKIYFDTVDGGIIATLTDKQRHNVDSYTQNISDKYTGDKLESALALNFETIRIISSIRFDQLNVLVNPKLNVFLFDINIDNTKINIISSGYVG
jgi:hypothetical protein